MRAFALFMAAVGLSAEAPPQPELQQFERALAASNFDAAATAIDKLIVLRTPVDGKPRPDPLLNALLGRLYLAAREVDTAATYLDHAPLADLPDSLRVPTALARGNAHAVLGDRAAALDAFRQAAAVSSSETDRRVAALGLARGLLPNDPVAARNQILTFASGPPSPGRWEAKYDLALASSLLGDGKNADRLADEAWADAANAPLRDLAPLRVAILRAGLAAGRHDLEAERAMLTAAGGVKLSGSPALAAQLPVCGDFGIRPADYVIFGFVEGPYGTRQLFPITASRVEVVAPFQHALDRTVPIAQAGEERPVGTIFTVACRTSVSPDYVAAPSNDNPLLDWFLERGIYPASASSEADDKHLNAVAERTDALAARFGKDSLLLIGPRWEMATLLERRARAGDPVLPGQLTDLGKQVGQGLRSAGAPEWLAQAIESRPQRDQLVAASAGDPDRLQVLQGQIREQLLRLPFRLGRQYLAAMLGNLHGEWPPSAANLVIDLNTNAPSAWDRRERQAWLLTLARAQQVLGKEQDARSTLAAGGFEKDWCSASDSDPKLLEQHFSYDDYPDDLIVGEQEGSVAIDFDLTTAGKIAHPRVVYSLPSGLFDQITTNGLAAIRYMPPTLSGKIAACRGVVQAIQWRIGDESDFSLPTLTPEMPGPVT